MTWCWHGTQRATKALLRGARANIDIRKQDAALADFDEVHDILDAQPVRRTRTHEYCSRSASLSRCGRTPAISLSSTPIRGLSRQVDQQHWLQRAGERRFPTAGENGHAIYWSSKPIGAGADTVFGWIRSELSPATKGTTLKSGTDR